MQYLINVLKKIAVLVLMYIVGNQVYAVNDGDRAQGKEQPEGATAMSPEDEELNCRTFSLKPVITCVFRHLGYFGQRQFLDVVLLNRRLEKHFKYLRRQHAFSYSLKFYDQSKIKNKKGIFLLESDHGEINVRGIPLPPELRTFEYSLPPESDIRIHVVALDDDEVFNQNDNEGDNEDSDTVSDSDFYQMFVVISTNEEPADLPQNPAPSGRHTVVGFMQGTPTDDSVDPDGKEGDLLVAPDWESLIANLQAWMVDSLIGHLNVDIDTRKRLTRLHNSEDKSDKEECRRFLITRLNRLMEGVPEFVRNTEETASISEAVSETSHEQQPDCSCDNPAGNRDTANRTDR